MIDRRSEGTGNMFKLANSALGLLVASAILVAAPVAKATNYTLGLGPAVAPDYEGSDNFAAGPAWVFSANDLYHPDTYVAVVGPLLRSNFVPDSNLRAGISGVFVGERKNVDDSKVDDLKDTEAAVMLGGSLGWDFFSETTMELTAAVEVTYDVANGNGWLVTPRIAYFNALPDSRFSFGAELFTNWASEDYMDEQFGIDSANAARSGLDTYNPDSSFKDVGLRLNGTYRISEGWSTTLAVQYKRMVGDASDSPIVDDRGNDNQFTAAATINYRF